MSAAAIVSLVACAWAVVATLLWCRREGFHDAYGHAEREEDR